MMIQRAIQPLTCERGLERLGDLLRSSFLDVGKGRVWRHPVVQTGDHGADGCRVVHLVNVVANDHSVELRRGRDRPQGTTHLDPDLGADFCDDGHPFPEGIRLDDLTRDWVGREQTNAFKNFNFRRVSFFFYVCLKHGRKIWKTETKSLRDTRYDKVPRVISDITHAEKFSTNNFFATFFQFNTNLGICK